MAVQSRLNTVCCNNVVCIIVFLYLDTIMCYIADTQTLTVTIMLYEFVKVCYIPFLSQVVSQVHVP